MRPERNLLFTALIAAALPACLYLPEQSVENKGREPLLVTSINVEEGETGLPRNVSIEVTFNQPLDPASLSEADMSLTSGALSSAANIRYDALSRTLIYDPRYDLREDLWYTFAIETFPLSIMGTVYGGDPVQVRFRTGTDTSPVSPRPGVAFEDDVWPILSGCSCHDVETRFMDYVIVYDAPEEFLERSVSTPSREWNDWLVVDPGHHESSYILYKLLGDDRLGMPTIMGEVMPPGAPLPMQDLETIRDWIEQGAGP
ncbi:MAG: Ig-like domain-containing protein [Deltaproteobacteria bacterium]|nr:Ig-like domain-containing protein [Deltaproteobacteria bacterium]